MYGRRLSAAALALLVGASVALACGPYFPWQLLDDRAYTLKSTPTNSFAFEAAHLVPPSRDKLRAVEPDRTSDDQYRDDQAAAKDKAESAGLTPDQISLTATMRGATSGDAAYAASDGLPPAIRLYTAGAVDIAKTDYAHAERRFAAVLALPTDQQWARATWAAYSLGRTFALDGDNSHATAAFAQTRTLVFRGAPDPLGLAVASFGEEARLHYDAANELLAKGGATVNPEYVGYTLPAHDADTYRRELTSAVALYAEQAARGSDSGVQSLRVVAEGIVSDPSRIEAAVGSPILQRLLVDFVLARVQDHAQQDAMGPAPDAGVRAKGITVAPLVPDLVAAIMKHGIARPAAADRLAALCYRTGRYDLASQLADRASGPLAEWVKAKIATQHGDLAAAAQHYAAASRAFPAAAPSLDAGNMTLIQGDRGVIALARGEYVEALHMLYPLGRTYWGDVAYLAERVLTLDELKDFVDANVGVVPMPAKTGDENAWTSNPAVMLRNLLARRLMREGRLDEAQTYFQDPKIRAQAKSYADARNEADSDWGNVDRANAFFRAAVIARDSGIDVLGYEASPDYAWTGGNFDWGVGQDVLKGPFISRGERERFEASKAVPNERFRYRYVAADEASRAADLLPPRSQAFAAVLCFATQWIVNRDAKRAATLYRRYIHEGAHLKWAAHFGQDCPEPDFNGAIYLERVQPLRTTRRFVSVHRWWVAGFGLFAALSTTALVARRKSAGAGYGPTNMTANRVARFFQRKRD
jgi:tetratricopeptide (TPR) repeat protein